MRVILKLFPSGIILSVAILQEALCQTKIVNYTKSSTYICILVEDRYIWAGIDGGLVRWDRTSNTYQRYTTAEGLPGMTVQSIIRDRNGKLWVRAAGKLAWFDGSRWRRDGSPVVDADSSCGLQKERVKAVLKDSCGLQDEIIGTVFKDSKGNCWFRTSSSGLVRWDGENCEVFDTTDGLSSNYIRDVKEDKDGHIWVATLPYWKRIGYGKYKMEGESGLCEYDGERWVRHDVPGNPLIWQIAFDSTGDLWLATKKGVYHWDGRRWDILKTEDPLTCPEINDILVDPDGVVWLATGASPLIIDCGDVYGGGLVRYDGRSFTLYDTSDGLPEKNIVSIARDFNGNLWIVTLCKGISKFDGERFENFTKVAGVRPELKVIVDHLGRIWAVADRGVVVYDGKEWAYHPIPELEEKYGGVLDIVEDKSGRIWAGTDWGAFYFDGVRWNKLKGLPFGSEDAYVHPLSVDMDGNLWMGVRGGLILISYDGSKFVTYTEADGLPSAAINVIDASAFSQKGGCLLVGTWGKGLAILDKHGWHTISQEDGLVGDLVLSIAIGRNSDVWVGTMNGLSHIYGLLPTSVEEAPTSNLQEMMIVYPNPSFGPVTFFLRSGLEAYLDIYNLLGQRVRRLEVSGGKVLWDGRDDGGREVSSGVYVVRLEVGGKVFARKVVMVR